MNTIEIIDKKRNKGILSKEEMDYIIDGYINEKVEEYQMSALLMAICLNGMNEEETINLTEAMIRNSEKLDLSSINGVTVDKHSTGGIGDKTTLIVVPIVASLGVNVVKMSGRALGFTGGTIDKLESIPGIRVNLSIEDFVNQVNNIGAAISYSSKDLVPVDKKMYALRDVTATVESIPLIAASIMSKKIVGSANKIVIDVKVGNGALIKNEEDAFELSKLMIKIGKKFDREVVCLLTNMNNPLGNNIGNALEVKEAMHILKGYGSEDLMKLCVYLSSYMVSLGLNIPFEEAVNRVKKNIQDGTAYNKFLEIIKYQGGNIEKLKVSDNKIDIISNKSGYITRIDSKTLGYIVNSLGAGRNSVADSIDYSVGIVMNKKVGNYVNNGETLCSVYYNNKINNIHNDILNCFNIEIEKKENEPLIYKILK